MRLCGITLCLVAAGCRRAGPPHTAEESLGMMRLEPGFRVELTASEPHVVSPVAMEIDEHGRVYVVEDPGYPLNPEGRLGKVKLLEDRDGDGRVDRSTIFADKLTLPTGVMRWKNGILVTDAPDLLYLEDADGDGRAEIRRVMLTGFAATNPQHTVNSPVYGLDNWIYLAHENPAVPVIFKDKFGDRGRDIHFADRPNVGAITARGRNIRFRPGTGEIEALAATSQFGHAFDEWGHHFVLNNSNHARVEAIAGRYLRRNPDLPLSSAMEDISDHGSASKVYPITADPRFEMLTNVGEFTSACGLTWHWGSLFVAEPVHNLVHRDLVSPKGAMFTARRARDAVEFLASSDSWFRPVNFYVAPDGALYMLDYYRLVIEHPEWTSTATHTSPDLALGIDRGRIYRIRRESEPPDRAALPGNQRPADWVRQLASGNAWRRRTAQRLLVDHKGAGVEADLAQMARESASAVGRLHALWTLDGIGRVDPELIRSALADPSPGVRESAIRLAEAARLDRDLIARADETDVRVRFQLLCSLGEIDSPAARTARDRLLAAHFADPWFQAAALSVSQAEAPRLFDLALRMPKQGREGMLRLAAAALAVRADAGVIARVIASREPSALEGLAAGSRGRAPAIGDSSRRLLLNLAESPERATRRAALDLLARAGPPADARAAVHLGAAKRAIATAENARLDPDRRADAVALVGITGAAGREKWLEKLIESSQPEPVEAAAVRARGTIPGDATGRYLLSRWRNLTPSSRFEAADAMYTEPGRVLLLVAALSSGEVRPWSLAFRHKRRLMMYSDPAIREAMRPLLELNAAERGELVRRYEPALNLSADPVRGRAVFDEFCAKCHRLNRVGKDIGPDLAGVRHQPKKVLLADIVEPSRSIAQGYETWVIETTSGTVTEGLLAAQTPESITLRHDDGRDEVIPRAALRGMRVTALSAMPEDLARQMSVQQMADLLEYIKVLYNDK